MKCKRKMKCIAILLMLAMIFGFTAWADDAIIEIPETVQVESIKIMLSGTMQAGEIQKIRVAVTPANAENYELEYYSSDNSVIIAAIGSIIAVAEGTADITVRVKDTEISDTAAVAVAKHEDVLITDIEFYNDDIYLERYEETKIKYDIIPSNAANAKVVFSSLNTSVATVDKAGYVYGKNNGTTRIKVQSEDGNVIKYVNVTVESYGSPNDIGNYVSVRRVDICDGENEVTKMVDIMKTQSKQFTAQIYPDTATDKRIRWKTEDADIAQVDENGVVTGISEGTVKIYAISRGNGIQDIITVEIIPYVRYPNSITIAPEENAIFETGQVIQFIPSFFPEDTTERSLTWHVYGINATVDYNGNVTVTDNGTVTVRAYSSDWKQSAAYEFEAAYSDNHFVQIAEGYGVKPHRPIVIEFDTEVNGKSAQYNIFAATDSTGNQNMVDIHITVDCSRIIITPSNGWNTGENYIYIKENIADIYGNRLGKNQKYKFNVGGLMK